MPKAIRLRSLILVAAAVVLTASAARAIGPLQFYTLSPCRVVDTRCPSCSVSPLPPVTNRGPALVNMGVRSFQFTGLCGVPSTAKAAVLNATIAYPTNSGYLILYPYGIATPLVANLNWDVGENAVGNGAIVPMTSGSLNITAFSELYGAPVGGGSVQLIIDVTGYFDCPPGTNPATCQ
jgi:hypothetical protein